MSTHALDTLLGDGSALLTTRTSGEGPPGRLPIDADTLRDDGLQPDERSISTEIAREEKAKDRRDVVLEETAHILADEIGLIRSDTKLAAQVLPRGVVVPTEVD